MFDLDTVLNGLTDHAKTVIGAMGEVKSLHKDLTSEVMKLTHTKDGLAKEILTLKDQFENMGAQVKNERKKEILAIQTKEHDLAAKATDLTQKESLIAAREAALSGNEKQFETLKDTYQRKLGLLDQREKELNDRIAQTNDLLKAQIK